MIRMHVRVDDVRDLHRLVVGELDVRVYILLLRIDDDALSLAAAAEHVRRAPGFETVERTEDHEVTLPTHGQPSRPPLGNTVVETNGIDAALAQPLHRLQRVDAVG